MSEGKITTSHLARTALVYVRQSSLSQVEHNRESTARQYDLVTRATGLGWPSAAVRVIDDDLGVSGASVAGRSGFAELVAQVGLGQVGVVVALEVSRLARNNSDWYKLLDLAGMTDTLIADADGLYHPALFNDRLLLGMKGTMSEAELHILRARLDGGIRNKAARGELRRGLPVGLIWADEADGGICFHPDEAVTGVLAAIFERFATAGSVRATWLWLREQRLKFPLQPTAYLQGSDIVWVEPTYHAVHNVLTHPAYAGAYTFGRSRQQRYVGDDGTLHTRRKRLPRNEWEVLIEDHHPAVIAWETYLSNQARIGKNIRPMAHEPGTGAVREGCALLQGLATCGTCGRKLAVYYDGRHHNTPGYYCTGTGHLIDGRNLRHLRIGGVAIDAADPQMAQIPAVDEVAGAGAVVAGGVVVPSVVVDGELAAAGPAGGQALQQRAALPDGAGAGLVCGGADVPPDPLLVGQVVIPVQESLMVVRDADLPLVAADPAPPCPQVPITGDVPLGAGAAVDVRAGVRRVGQRGVHRVVGGFHPDHLRCRRCRTGRRLQRPFQVLFPQPQPGPADRPARGEPGEHRGDHPGDGLVRVQQDLTLVLAPDQPHRQAAA